MKQFSKLYYTKNVVGNGVRTLRKLATSQDIFNYVSLGDSIAAGHAINDDWEHAYGTDSQYGVNGNTSTVIVPNTYTDLLSKSIITKYGTDGTNTSFARSGDAVSHLITKLDNPEVISAIREADLITICIGANDLLQPALDFLEEGMEEYINTGDLSGLASTMEGNLARLNDDSNATSYMALMNKLKSINSKAKFVFTTIYNPYKYLWIEEGENGFFKPLLSWIPQMTVLGVEIDQLIKDEFFKNDVIKKLFARVNGIGEWVEPFINRLNDILKDKVNASNLYLADTKAIFDTMPDRPISADKHYNDLVNVEYTRGYNTATMDWGKLYEGTTAVGWWFNLINKYQLDVTSMINDVADQVINKVIIPDIDPHPEWYGHVILKQVFETAITWDTISRYTITFKPNVYGDGVMTQEVVGLLGTTSYVNLKPNIFTPNTEGYYFTGWNTSPDGSGARYDEESVIGVNGDVTLYAQWSNLYTINFYKTLNEHAYGVFTAQNGVENNTGRQTQDGVRLYEVSTSNDGSNYSLLSNSYYYGNFSASGKKYIKSVSIPYGTWIKVMVTHTRGNSQTISIPFVGSYTKYECKATTAHIYVNGNLTKSDYKSEYAFQLKKDTDITFEYVTSGVAWGDSSVGVEEGTINWNAHIE